jgi:hypothetical protein
MDMDPAAINNFTVDGDLYINDRDTVINARFIWVRAGSIFAGTNLIPFTNKLDIIING